MAVRKEENGTYTVQLWYRDWKGTRHKKTKRGFRLKSEANKWQRDFLFRVKNSPEMLFEDFIETYKADMRPRIRENTWNTKEYIIRDKILPYFKGKKLNEITPADILSWQAMLLTGTSATSGKKYSKTYLRTINNILASIFNHAVRFYRLESNPMHKTGKIGSATADEMKFWTKDEYIRFSEAIMDKPKSYMIFELLYWCGIREGEALALTPDDFDFKKHLLTINKSYQRINKQDVITPPKTEKSNRVIVMPDFLNEEVREYILLEGYESGERIFPLSKSFLHHEMDRGSEAAGVKRIRIHDLRHSHVSLLIELGFNALAIANRVGHETTDITYRYAHMFPDTQGNMAKALSFERNDYIERKGNGL